MSFKAIWASVVRGLGKKLALALLLFALLGLGLLGWWQYSSIGNFIDTGITRFGQLLSSTLRIVNIPPRAVCVIFALLLLGEGMFVRAFFRTRTKRAPTGDRSPTAFGYGFILLGLPLFVFGLTIHVDGRLSPLVVHSVPFPGWEVAVSILGSSLLFHGVFWGRMPQWQKSLKLIDYVWYVGGTVALILGATNLYKSDEVAFFEATVTRYDWYKPKIVEKLAILSSYCSGQKAVLDENYRAGSHTRPSELLCRIAEKEKELWEADSLLKLSGFATRVDFRLLNPYLRHSTGSTEAEVEYSYALFKYLQSGWGWNGELFCRLAAAEWRASGWDTIEKSMLKQSREATPSPSAKLDFDVGKIGERRLRLRGSPFLGPPHKFGTDVCSHREDLINRFKIHAGRTFLIVPPWIQPLTHSWLMIFGIFISLRLLKVTAELRRIG